MTCEHPDAFRIDDGKVEGFWCPECKTLVGRTCEICWGDGFVSEAEYHCDWINYTDDDFISCPECHGEGTIWFDVSDEVEAERAKERLARWNAAARKGGE